MPNAHGLIGWRMVDVALPLYSKIHLIYPELYSNVHRPAAMKGHSHSSLVEDVSSHLLLYVAVLSRQAGCD